MDGILQISFIRLRAFGQRFASVVLLGAQAAVTIWFWASNISDQLLAEPHQNGPTATWLGSTVLFLMITAGLQWSTIRQQQHRPGSWKAIEVRTLYAIMVVSAIGGTVSFLVYAFRRPGWTLGDSACLVDMVTLGLLLFLWTHRKRRLRAYRHRTPILLSTEGRMHLAIVLRSVPRVIYGLSFFAAAFVSMSTHTIISGEFIALLRLASALQVHYARPCDSSRRLLHAELIGNFGSQTLMALCWLIVIYR